MYDRGLIRKCADDVHAAMMAAKARNAEKGDESPITATITTEEINQATNRRRLSAAVRSLLISDLLAHPELELVHGSGPDVVVRTAPERVITAFASLTDLKGYGK